MYRLTRLQNGLTVATAEMPHMASISLGVWVGVGGRHEPAGLNGASHFYGVYETSDGRWFSLGSIEPHFYEALTNVLGIEEMRHEQHNQARWPEF